MSDRLPAFADRADAGRRLGEILADRVHGDVIVYAIPRGGVPVALEVAQALEAPLDLALVRKIGAPRDPEVALAAVIGGNHPRTVINEEIVRMTGTPPDWLERERVAALAEIERRRRLYLDGRRSLDPKGHVAVLVDDGMATGATARAAIAGLRAQGVRRIVLAVPVAPPTLAAALREEVDEFVCLLEPDPFRSVGEAYRDFRQVSDADVVACLGGSAS
ncbi:MAG: phosphoribosyltransferase family protein [Brevundimonas sp.]|uniref:phosphoribosyltransferase n=1 Tax=Brevundimonas sp. TaxID=1871086 RepID=UPI0027371C29|nr:phosphoribosyltransferase family protein [Brevundimonas sp.]MDP3368765.1 phosphoribosyltransferase family protein [Brevundimonas sp.]MDP3658266.1 phosphoribosyltransferase family protein [Brevundimonas sp.]MDZ4112993.1 phosphoribosyltransferase family protein [Brevundimonas sp.]